MKKLRARILDKVGIQFQEKLDVEEKRVWNAESAEEFLAYYDLDALHGYISERGAKARRKKTARAVARRGVDPDHPLGEFLCEEDGGRRGRGGRRATGH